VASESRTIFPILETLTVRYRFVLGVPFIAAVVTSVIVLLMTPAYTSTASFVPESSPGVQVPAGLAGVASQFGVSLGGQASRSPAFYASLLRSREVLASVLTARIGRGQDSMTVFDLYHIQGSSPAQQLEEGIKALQNQMGVTVDQRTDVVRVRLEAPDPLAARDVLQLLLDRLAVFNLDTRQSSAAERRRFIEGRVTNAEQHLRTAEEALRTFYERNRQWQSSPKLRFEEQRLNRQVNVQQDLYLTLRREYETARIEEVNNTPVLTIIDHPSVPGMRSRPRRTMTVLLVTAVAAIIAAVLAILRQQHLDLLAAGDPEYVRFHKRLITLFRKPDSGLASPTAPR
jgi:uncharacterized protein involved in exopolysaccharide biosynthesis